MHFVLAVALAISIFGAAPRHRAHVIVYGATPSGVMAAVTAARAGETVTLIEPTTQVGGAIANGLTYTDIGDKTTVGGFTREFFDHIHEAYAPYGVLTRWTYQPHVAERVFRDMLASTNVSLVQGEIVGVTKSGPRLTSVRLASGRVFIGRVFIDATYTGDLMALAGVPYVVGREAAATYNEPLAGVRPTGTVGAGTPAPWALGAPDPVGSGDDRVQFANFRKCWSKAATRTSFTEPPGYNPVDYEHVLPRFEGNPTLGAVFNPVPTVRSQYDVNGGDFALPPGYADMTPAEREVVAADRAAYTRGLTYFVATDLRVPLAVRNEMATFGWCETEWLGNDNFPPQMYVRESRRMVGMYVMTQRDVAAGVVKSSAVAWGSYRLDSHWVSEWADDGIIYHEGSVWAPYVNFPLPFRSLLPLPADSTNLIVTSAVSASHVAFSAIRMEPHLMMLGEAAGEAAHLAVTQNRDIQTVSYAAIRAALTSHGAVVP